MDVDGEFQNSEEFAVVVSPVIEFGFSSLIIAEIRQEHWSMPEQTPHFDML